LNPSLVGHIWNTDAEGQRGCTDDLYGCDTTVALKGNLGNGNVYPYLTADNENNGTCGHGTHVAGIIAATASGVQPDGVGGVCPVCRIMPIKIITSQG